MNRMRARTRFARAQVLLDAGRAAQALAAFEQLQARVRACVCARACAVEHVHVCVGARAWLCLCAFVCFARVLPLCASLCFLLDVASTAKADAQAPLQRRPDRINPDSVSQSVSHAESSLLRDF